MRKTVLLCFLVLLALATTGAGYAHWSQTLYIGGEVNTGELCWGFEEGSLGPVRDNEFPPPDQHPSNWDWTCPVGFGPPTQQEKNVGWITWDLEGEKGVHGLYKLYGTATVTLHKVYPCYFTEISVVVANGGTIPVVFHKVLIDDTEVATGELYYNDYMEFKWLDGAGPPPIQLDPCDSTELSFVVHIIEEDDYPDITGAQPDQTYYFTIQLVGTQWNLAP